MTKIKFTKKKLNLDIRKSRSPRKKKLKRIIKIKVFKKNLNKGMTKIKIVEKIKQKYDKNKG